MKASAFVGCFFVGMASLAYGQTLRHLDLLVGLSGLNDSGIYVVDLTTGEIRGLLSGRGMKPAFPPDASRGTGPALSSLPGLITTRNGRIFASATSASKPSLVQIDPLTGNRAQVAGNWPSQFSSAGALAAIDQNTVLAGARVSGAHNLISQVGALYTIDLATGVAMLTAGGALADGPAFDNPMSIVALNRHAAYVADYNASGTTGPVVFRLDLSAPQHSILSIPSNQPVTRFSVAGGIVSDAPSVIFPDGYGSGPVCSDTAYRMATVDGDLYLVESSFSQGLGSGVIRIDAVSGDRTLVLGKALDSQGQVIEFPPSSGPVGFGVLDPSVLLESPTREMLIGEWSPYGRILAFDLSTRAVRVVADFAAYFHTPTTPIMRTMAIYTNCPADINLDGVADDADFSRFAIAYDILDCADDAMPIPCPSDLNADDVVDDEDFSIFLIGYDALVCD